MPSVPDHGPARSAVRAARATTRAVGSLAGRVTGARAGSGSARRVLTVAAPLPVLAELWSDEAVLARILAEPWTGTPRGFRAEVLERGERRVAFRGRPADADAPELTGVVTLAPGRPDLGTLVTLQLDSAAPALALGAAAHKALRRAKALAETGEIPTLAHNPSGRRRAEEEDA